MPDTNFTMRCKNRETIIELHSCLTHSHPDKKAICWKDEHGICYPVTESNLNLWANMVVRILQVISHVSEIRCSCIQQTQHPDKYYVSQMPPEVNARQNGPRARAPAKLQPPASNVPSIGMGMNYYHPYYRSLPPAPLPYPGMQAYSMPAPPSDQLATQTNPAADLDYPLITRWLSYCDQHARRGGRDLSKHAVAFDDEGFVTIDQLVGPRVNIEKLSEWLGIRKGTADLILRYAEMDVGLVKAGKLNLNDSN